jgi:hypothetical protein
VRELQRDQSYERESQLRLVRTQEALTDHHVEPPGSTGSGGWARCSTRRAPQPQENAMQWEQTRKTRKLLAQGITSDRCHCGRKMRHRDADGHLTCKQPHCLARSMG